MHDPAHHHIGSCSPCFSELTDIRHALHRRSLMWTMGTAGTAVLALAALITYFAFLRVDGPVRREAVQPAASEGAPQTVESILNSPPPQSDHVIAMLDLRYASTTRTVQPSGADSNVKPIEIPRGLLALTVQLPIGSEAGLYDVEIRKPNQPATKAAKGQATVENGITKLPVEVDTSVVSPGEYEFAWRLGEGGWMNRRILIR